jgi:molybdopterin converting factor small subunit
MEATASTIAVRVRFIGDLPAVTGQREIVVTLPEGSTVADLMSDLSMTYGEAFTTRVFSSPTKLHHSVLLFVDGQKLKQHGGLTTKLGNSKTEIIMLPMFGGG